MAEESQNIEQDISSTQEQAQDSRITFTVESNDTQSSFNTIEQQIVNNTSVGNNTEESWVDVPFEELEHDANIDSEQGRSSSNGNDFEDEENILVEASPEILFKMLKDQKGFEYDSIDDLLTPKEQKKYAPELEKYQEFIEKTGNTNFNDFQATQRDWNAETPEDRLKEYIKAKNPELSKKELDFLYDDKYNIEDLDEEDDERIILQKGINAKTDLREANEFLEKRKQEYMAERGSDAHIPVEYREAKALIEKFEQQQEATDLERQVIRDDYVSKINDYFTKDYDGIKVKFGNDEIGYEEVSFKPENIQETKDRHTDISNFNSKFFDEKGNLVKPKEWNEALYMAENWQSELNKAYNRGIAKKLEIDDKLSKNIQPDNLRNVSENRSSGITFTIEK